MWFSIQLSNGPRSHVFYRWRWRVTPKEHHESAQVFVFVLRAVIASSAGWDGDQVTGQWSIKEKLGGDVFAGSDFESRAQDADFGIRGVHARVRSFT